MAQAFVLPADLALTLTKTGFSLEHSGDVTLGQTFGRSIEHIKVGGNLTLDVGTIQGIVRADGIVRITGDVDCDTIYGREVHLNSANITARAISASERIVIGDAKLKVDILLAPSIELDSKARGRVTVIECNGDLPASKVRGGYTLEEYDEDFGDSATFLAERGVSRLGDAPVEQDAPIIASDDEEEDEDDEDEDEAEEDPSDIDIGDDLTESTSKSYDADENVDDPVSLPNVELTPLAAEDPLEEDDEDELYPKLSEALERIVSCYTDEIPPPVETLQTTISARDYDTLRANITDVWTGLLGYHQQRGIRPHHQVTHAFNVIHGLVTEG